jgi:hypothetical protein
MSANKQTVKKPTAAAKPAKPVKITAKPVPKETPAEPAPAVETPQATPAAPAVETPQAAPVAEAPQAEKQESGPNISSARVRRHLDRMNMNKEIDVLLRPLKTELNADERAKKALKEGVEHEQVAEEVERDNGKGKMVKVKVMKDVTKPLNDARRAELQAAVDAFAPRFKEVSERAAALSKERVRFSSDAPVVLSIVFDELVQQLLEHAMNRVLLADKKIIQINHLHEEGVEKLSLYPLIKTLPSWTKIADEIADKAKDEAFQKALEKALAQAEKDFKKKYAALLSQKKKKKEVVAAVVDAAPAAAEAAPADAPAAEDAPVEPAAAEAAPVEDAEEDVADESKDKTTFNFYVNNACRKLIKSNDRYKKVRVSTDIRQYLSTLLIELITRLSTLIKLTTDSMKVKTVNRTPILNTIRTLLIDGHVPTEVISFTTKQVPDPELLKAEQAKRDESLAAREAAAKNGTELPAEYKFDVNALPKVDGLVAERKVSFGTSKFDELYETIMTKLEPEATEKGGLDLKLHVKW